MDPLIEKDCSDVVQARTGGTAFAGALLIFFGFFWGLLPPETDDLFGKAALVFYYSLRIGGILLIGVAIWLSVGHPPALLVDSILSVVIGLVFVVTGVVMVVDGGDFFQTIINVACGSTFVAVGLRSGGDYREFRRWERQTGGAEPVRVGEEWLGPKNASRDDAHRHASSPAIKNPDGYLARYAKDEQSEETPKAQ